MADLHMTGSHMAGPHMADPHKADPRKADPRTAGHHRAADLDTQVQVEAKIHPEALVDTDLDKGLVNNVADSSSEVDLVDILDAFVAHRVEETALQTAEGPEVVSCYSQNLGFCWAMPETQLSGMGKGSFWQGYHHFLPSRLDLD